MNSILFVCTGNSCRSQMAEGFARELLAGWRIGSAGLEAHGLNPRAVAVMAEAGVDISQQTSDCLDGINLTDYELLVTVCGHADEHCPVLIGKQQKLHWPFDDPAKMTGTEEEIMQGFRRVRDEIRSRLRDFGKSQPS